MVQDFVNRVVFVVASVVAPYVKERMTNREELQMLARFCRLGRQGMLTSLAALLPGVFAAGHVAVEQPARLLVTLRDRVDVPSACALQPVADLNPALGAALVLVKAHFWQGGEHGPQQEKENAENVLVSLRIQRGHAEAHIGGAEAAA